MWVAGPAPLRTQWHRLSSYTRANPQGLLCPSCVDWTQLFARISLDVSLSNLQGAVKQPVRLSTCCTTVLWPGTAIRKRKCKNSAMSLYLNIILFDTPTNVKPAPCEHSMFVAMRQESRKALSSAIYALGPNELRCSIEQKMRRHDFQQKVQFHVVWLLILLTARVGREADLHLPSWHWPWAWLGR